MNFHTQYFDLGRLDRLSYRKTAVQALDPRAKVVATGLFLVTVVSFPKHDVAGLVPFLLLPVLAAALGEIPFGFILRKVLIVSPFAVFVGIFNPFLDTRIVAVVAGLPVSAGWFSFASILFKFLLTVSAALLLVATTSFPGVCHALRRLGCPPVFVSQLLFLYRYLFVLVEEAMRIVRAWDMRAVAGRGRGATVFARLVGVLLIRTLDRAERIYQAMLCRGFAGDIPRLGSLRLRSSDVIFVAATAVFLGVCRFFPVTEGIGFLVKEIWR